MKSPVDYLQKRIVEMHKANFCVLIFIALSLFFNAFAYGEFGDKDILSANERDWLAKNQSRLVLAVETGYAPFVFIDEKGQPTGLAHDYMRLIESKIGVHFNQQRFPNLNEVFKAIHNGDVQIVNAVTNTPERSKFLAITDPFISVPNVIIVRKDHSGPMTENDLQGLRVSLVKNYAITEHMASRGLHFTPDLVADDLSALLNVSFGRSDAAVIDLATASYLISEKGISNLSVAGDVMYDIRLALGTPLDEPVLHDILQKGLNAITVAERLEMKNRWVSASKSQSIFKDRQFWLVLGSVLAIAFVVLAVILAWNRNLRQQVELRKKAEHALQTIINNEPECIKIVDAQGLLTQMNPAGLAMIEADSLEQVMNNPMLNFIAPEYRAKFDKMHQRVIAGDVAQMEFEVIGLKGGRRRLETHAVPMQDNGKTVHLALTRNITQRKLMEEQVRQLAFYDPLTQLPNRRLLNDRLSQAMSAGERYGLHGAFMFLDLDNFKPINDAHGHGVGDLLLIEAANRLRNCMREMDTVARFGGDEFVVMLSELDIDKAESNLKASLVAEKIRAILSEPYLLTIKHEGKANTIVEHHCTASIGVVVFIGHEVCQDDLIERADAAMYQAKNAGHNQIRFYGEKG
jgi:diguanylate cyclase (GGDEF)-like protein/PAS domain S-box-containing protein